MERAGLQARSGLNGESPVPTRTAAPVVGRAPADYRPFNKRKDPEVIDIDADGESGKSSESELSSSKVTSSKVSSDASSKESGNSLESTGDASTKSTHKHGTASASKTPTSSEDTAGPTATPSVIDVDQPMDGKPGKSGTMVPDLHYISDEEGHTASDEGACDDDEEPFTVYVTVTVTPGQSAEPTSTSDENDCTDDCYSATDGDPGATPAPIPTDSSEDDAHASSSVEDEFASSDIYASSASASATGDSDFDDDFAGAYARFSAVPVVVSLIICAITSLAAGFVFLGP